MAFKTISVVLTANASSLRSQLLAAARDVDTFGHKVDGSTASLSGTQVAATAAAAGIAALAVGTAVAARSAIEFETRMRNVNSISGLSEQALAALGGRVVDLSRQLPQSANVLAEGLYEIASSGFQGAEGIKVLEAAAKAASAGLTDTAVSGKAITAILNAYGLGADKATDVSDALFQTVNLGVVSFGELSQVIGDTIGTAAAAKVGYEEVGAAIATMTLAGVSGAESSTSLNRVLQSIIQPSDALALVFRQLGYESGAAALEQDGLRGVIEKLRVATGGQIDSLLQLFPEIRAARGALALMSNEGRNYTRVSGQIEDANARQGATQRALQEQLKAVSAQWRLFVNRANAAAIELGTRLLPVITDVLTAVQRLGSRAAPMVEQAMAALLPFFRNLRDIGVDVIDIVRSLVGELSPLTKAIAGIAAGTVITALNSLSALLATIAGFLADHPALVEALAAAYGVHLVASVARATVAFLDLTRVGISVYFLDAGDAAKSFGSSMFWAANGAKTLSGVMLGAALLGVNALANGLANADRRAKDLVSRIEADVDPTVLSSIRDAATRTNEELNKTLAGNDLVEYGRKLKSALQFANPFDRNTEINAQRRGKALAKEQEHLNRLLVQSRENVAAIRNATGLSEAGVEALARKLEINLTGGFTSSEPARRKLIDQVRELGTVAGAAGVELSDASTLDIAKLQELKSVVDEVASRVGDAFSSSTDFIAAFKTDAAQSSTQAVEDARDQLESAQSSLDDLQRRGRQKSRQDASDQRDLAQARARVNEASRKGADEQAAAASALADVEDRIASHAESQANDARDLQRARQRVADATNAVREAESKVTTQGGQIRTFYEQQIALTSQFATDLTTAAQKGLDPEVLKRLLTAGPEQAAPILQALLSDNSGKLISMVNESEQKLREINAKVVEFARLTQKAVSSETDTMPRDLGAAMEIASQNMAQGAKATVESIAAAIGKPSDEVRRIAAEYGITLADEVASGFGQALPNRLAKYINFGPAILGAQPQRPIPDDQQTASRSRGSYHGGGYLDGAPGADMPITAQSGEYVMRAAAVRAIGVDNLHAMNRRPTFHEGGLVGRYVAPMPSRPAGVGGWGIDYSQLAKALVRAGVGASSTTIDARQSVQIRGERPTRADLEYANRQHAWALAGVVTR